MASLDGGKRAQRVCKEPRLLLLGSFELSRRSIFSAVARPEAKLEQMRWSSRVFMKPADFVRCLSASVNASAARYARSKG